MGLRADRAGVAGISSAAKLRVQVLMVHLSCSAGVPRCTRIVVSAVETTSAPSTTISEAAAAGAGIRRRAGAGRPAISVRVAVL